LAPTLNFTETRVVSVTKHAERWTWPPPIEQTMHKILVVNMTLEFRTPIMYLKEPTEEP